MRPAGRVTRVLAATLVATALQAAAPMAMAQVPTRRVETALPPNGLLPPSPSLTETPDTSIQARVLHFLLHLFGTQHTPVHSPFTNECGQRPCPYDLRN